VDVGYGLDASRLVMNPFPDLLELSSGFGEERAWGADLSLSAAP
jgi:hypothetical protein